MIICKSDYEIEIMHRCNQIVAQILVELKNYIKPGISTKDIEEKTDELSRHHGVKPAFKGYKGFPSSLCVSVNDQVVHGIPSRERILKDGDIVSLDYGAKLNGYFGDSALTVEVGTVSIETKKLLRVTEESLYVGIEFCRPQYELGDICRSIQEHVEKNGFSVVRDFVGHGIGTNLHEDPQVPNYFVESAPVFRTQLKKGMVLAIEPMVNMGSAKVRILKDKWTAVTMDGKPSAHFEHSVAITDNEPLILSKL